MDLRAHRRDRKIFGHPGRVHFENPQMAAALAPLHLGQIGGAPRDPQTWSNQEIVPGAGSRSETAKSCRVVASAKSAQASVKLACACADAKSTKTESKRP